MPSAPPQTDKQPDEVADLRARADQGDAEAQYKLAMMYSDGQGVSQDEVQAVGWFRKAAQQGNADAQFCLGVNCEFGLGVQQDYTQAVLWFCRAVEQGHTVALFELGVMYAFGRGVPQDFAEAFMWMHLATDRATCRSEKKPYRHGRTAIANWLTRTQMAEARKLAHVWTARFEERQKKQKRMP